MSHSLILDDTSVSALIKQTCPDYLTSVTSKLLVEVEVKEGLGDNSLPSTQEGRALVVPAT